MTLDLKTEAARARRLVQSEWRAIKEDPSRKHILIESETDLIEAVGEQMQAILTCADEIETIKASTAAANDEKKRLEKHLKQLHQEIAEALYPIGKITVGNRKVIPSRSPDSVEITDKALIPDALMKVKAVKEPDKAAIKKALENGETVPGAALITGKVKVAL